MGESKAGAEKRKKIAKHTCSSCGLVFNRLTQLPQVVHVPPVYQAGLCLDCCTAAANAVRAALKHRKDLMAS